MVPLPSPYIPTSTTAPHLSPHHAPPTRNCHGDATDTTPAHFPGETPPKTAPRHALLGARRERQALPPPGLVHSLRRTHLARVLPAQACPVSGRGGMSRCRDWSAGGGAVSLQKSAGAYGGGTVYGSAYGGSATLDCQPLVYPPSHSSFNPYHSFASLVEPTPAYPLLAEQQPALGEFRSFSMPPAKQQAYQHATNFAPSAAGASQAASQQQYTETDGYGQPAWQTGLHASASKPSVLFPASSDTNGAGPLGWPSSTRWKPS
ncbi:hypothetical protein PTTG_30748 [Puccinia triticina 1-1 BBBD Race 1]|uniref:Uncharacterized protein n=1 Tax=Puccinia triticina (isolate 1-1 / race 1 (BBBD)) TaxID=630390 RepID=A0A180FXY3_PUCT1|nr:hypothetical protein PTTG_30748 [Puccinia triticina 1-1 BBBD Race 1]